MSHRDTKLYVGNLSPTTTRTELEKEFGYYGHLVNVWVARNPPGFAYVEFEDARDAEDAIKLDGRTVGGRRVRVEIAHGMRGRGGGWDSRDRDRVQRRGFNPNDKCYNCGERGHYAYDCALYRRRRRSYTRSRSRSPRRRRSRSRSRSYRRKRSYSRSRSKSYSRSRSRSRSRSHKSSSRSRSRSRSKSSDRKKSSRKSRERNGRSKSKSRSRSSSKSRSSKSRSP